MLMMGKHTTQQAQALIGTERLFLDSTAASGATFDGACCCLLNH